MSFGHSVTLVGDNPLDGDHAASITFAPVSMDDRGTLRLTLDVTKAGGTEPTLDVGSERLCFVGADRYVRAVATIGGTTPAFRCTVAGDAL